jgi:hypothetical protein
MSSFRQAKVMSLCSALNTLEESVGGSKTSLIGLFALDSVMNVSPMEFVGLGHLEAAKRWLKKKADAGASFQQIVDGLRMGGVLLSKQEQDDLRLSLGRSTFEVIKNGDFYALLEFFPHIKRGRRGRPRTMSEQISTQLDRELTGIEEASESPLLDEE